MAIKRQKMHLIFDTVKESWGSFDDFPAMPPGTDPMPHLSRNTVSQPFYLVSDRDETLINLTGEGELWLRDAYQPRMELVAGDIVYIPAGVPSRIITRTPSVQIRLKADTPGREAVAWYCPRCDELLFWRDIDTSTQIAQAAYWDAMQEFNNSAPLRTCAACNAEHPAVDPGDIAWPEVASALGTEEG